MAKGIVVYIDGSVEVKEFNSLQDYQEVVGGKIESVPLGKEADFYCNEDGKVICEPNVFGTFLAQTHASLFPGDFVAGNIIIIGKPDEDGNDTDAPEWAFQLEKDFNAEGDV